MSKEKVELEHYIRKMIYNHILEYPGVSFSTLKKVHDLNDSTLRYHLKYLERAEWVSPQLENGQLHYYPYNSTERKSKSSTEHPTHTLTQHQETILSIIKLHPGITQKELGDRTALKRFILTYNIPKLIDLGMVRKVNNGSKVCYEYITPQQLDHEMLKVLAIKLLKNEIDEQTFNELKRKLGS
jgi:predicted transcriptional regulator